MRRINTSLEKTVLVIIFIIILSSLVIAVNDPGHDTLYIEEQGDSEVNGSLNITDNTSVKGGKANFIDYLDIYFDGTTVTSPSVNTIAGTNTYLAIDGVGDVFINRYTSSGTVYLGYTGDTVNLNITGALYVQSSTATINGQNICLQDGTNCPAGANATGNVTGVGLANRVAFWTDADTLSYDDNLTWNNTGKRLGVGTSSPTAQVELGMKNPVFKARLEGAGAPNYLDGPYAVKVQGKYAYVAVGGIDDGLTIVDISDPASPKTLSHLNVCNTPEHIDVAGDYAYITCWSSTFRIVDISDPKNPSLTATVSISAASAVYVSGKYAYVGSFGNNKLYVIDVSDPANPQIKGNVFMNSTSGIYVTGKYAYVGSYYDDNITVVNVSDPTNPTVVGSLKHSTYLNAIRSISVSGSYAYVAAGDGDYLTIVNVSDPTNLSIISYIGGAGSPNYLNHPDTAFVAGKYVYVHAIRDNSLTVIDVSDPTNPTFAGNLVATSGSYQDSLGDSLVVAGKYAYMVTEHNDSFVVADISGIDTPTISTGSIETSQLYVSGNAYLGNDIRVRNSLNIGSGGIYSHGPVAVSDTTKPSYFSSNVGIGYTSPTTKLDVNGTINATNILINGTPVGTGGGNVTGQGVANRVAFWTDADTLSYDGNLTWNNSNKRLGIGTTSPSQELEVNGDISLQNLNNRIYFVEESSIGEYIGSPYAGAIDFVSRERMRFYTETNINDPDTLPMYEFHTSETVGAKGSGNAKMVILDNGNVGIGTTSPNASLHVEGNISQNDNYYHCFGDNCDGYIYWNGTSLIIKVT